MLDFKPTEDILTQNGRATSVFLSAADWEKICQKMYDAEVYEDILVSEGESERGEVYTHDEVKRMIQADLKKLSKGHKTASKRPPKNREVA